MKSFLTRDKNDQTFSECLNEPLSWEIVHILVSKWLIHEEVLAELKI